MYRTCGHAALDSEPPSHAAPADASRLSLSGSNGYVPEAIRASIVERFKGACIVESEDDATGDPTVRKVAVFEGGAGWYTMQVDPVPLAATYARPVATMSPTARHCRALELEATNRALGREAGDFIAAEVARDPVRAREGGEAARGRPPQLPPKPTHPFTHRADLPAQTHPVRLSTRPPSPALQPAHVRTRPPK